METTFWLVLTILLFLGAFYYIWSKHLKNRGHRLHIRDKFSGSTQTISSEIIHRSPLLQNNINIMIQPTIQLKVVQKKSESNIKGKISSTSTDKLDQTVVFRCSESSEMIASANPIYSEHVTNAPTDTSTMLQIFAYFSNKKEAKSIVMNDVEGVYFLLCMENTVLYQSEYLRSLLFTNDFMKFHIEIEKLKAIYSSTLVTFEYWAYNLGRQDSQIGSCFLDLSAITYNNSTKFYPILSLDCSSNFPSMDMRVIVAQESKTAPSFIELPSSEDPSTDRFSYFSSNSSQVKWKTLQSTDFIQSVEKIKMRYKALLTKATRPVSEPPKFENLPQKNIFNSTKKLNAQSSENSIDSYNQVWNIFDETSFEYEKPVRRTKTLPSDSKFIFDQAFQEVEKRLSNLETRASQLVWKTPSPKRRENFFSTSPTESSSEN